MPFQPRCSSNHIVFEPPTVAPASRKVSPCLFENKMSRRRSWSPLARYAAGFLGTSICSVHCSPFHPQWQRHFEVKGCRRPRSLQVCSFSIRMQVALMLWLIWRFALQVSYGLMPSVRPETGTAARSIASTQMRMTPFWLLVAGDVTHTPAKVHARGIQQMDGQPVV